MFRVKPDRRWISALVVFFLTSCTPVIPSAATSIPTQRIWEVSYPPEAAWMAVLFDDCLQSDWNTGIVIEEVMDAQTGNRPAAVQLVWGDVEPHSLSAYQLGTDSIRVVAHPNSTLQNISLDQFRDILSGSIQDWGELDSDADGELHGWIYPDFLSIQRELLVSLDGYDRLSPYFNIAPDVNAMLEAVSADPLAIGFIPAAWPKGDLVEIDVTDWSAPNVPVVALVRDEDPQLAAWLKCLGDDFPD